MVKEEKINHHPYGGASWSHVKLMLSQWPNLKTNLFPHKVKFIKFCSKSSAPLPFLEKIQHKKVRQTEISNGPIFIIGHWRSGTTFMHNLMTQDQQFGFLNQFQALCPAYFLHRPWTYRWIYKYFLPKERPVDKVPLGVHLPQEDEFAIANVSTLSCYHGLYFPSKRNYYFDKFLSLENLAPEEKEEWVQKYKWLLAKLTFSNAGKQLILKNPPHTARIKFLKQIYPKAKFIFLVRRPEEVIASSHKFFVQILKLFSLEKKYSLTHYDLIDTYEKLLKNVKNELNDLKANEFVGVKYEDLIQSPHEVVKMIYQKLEIQGYKENTFNEFIKGQKKHKTQEYKDLDYIKSLLGNQFNKIYQEHLECCDQLS